MRRLLLLALAATSLPAQETRLLRQPSLGPTSIAFAHGGDLWVVGRDGGEARRLTSTPAVESDPHLSPDGRWVAFTSNRAGAPAVWVVGAEGGDARRVTWNPANSFARGWTPDGRRILYASERAAAPSAYTRLWTIPVEGGPATLVPAPMGWAGSFSPDGRHIAVDRVDRWDVEFRHYRGGQNTPITILDLNTLDEERLPNARTTDVEPVWLGGTVYFLSDREGGVSNVWAYDAASRALRQVTRFRDDGVKSLDGRDGTLVVEQAGRLHLVDAVRGEARALAVTVRGDFPWAAPRWADVSRTLATAQLGPQGKRALFEARGEIFTVPVEKGDARNLTRSAGAADRAPVWSPDGARIAWVSDSGAGYAMVIASADGAGARRTLSLGESRMIWTPVWSPDGSRIAYVDDRARLQVLEVASGRITTADQGSQPGDRSAMAPRWSPDSKWLAYSKAFPNNFRRVLVWSLADGRARVITDALANAEQPAWDRNGKWLYLLASTDLGVRSGWADLGSITRTSTSAPYVVVLRADEPTPFVPESDEEAAARAQAATQPPGAPGTTPPSSGTQQVTQTRDTASAARAPGDTAARGRTPVPTVRIDFERIDRRIVALPMPPRAYGTLLPGPAGILFVTEGVPNQPGSTLHKWDMAKRRAEPFVTGVSRVSISNDGRKLLWQQGQSWTVSDAGALPRPGEGRLTVALQAPLDPRREWRQVWDEAWRIERDFFYDPGLHGADWEAVRRRYEPLVGHVRHRADLTYLLDQLGGELAVGHSFVGGGDMPAVDSVRIGRLGADFVADGDRWRIVRIYTSESWNPGLRAPLDAPGVKARAGDYVLEIDGVPVTTGQEIDRWLDGTLDRQTRLRLASRADGSDAWTVTVVPTGNDLALRQRAWVEDNRRRVDSLSGGRLAYVWVPNTGTGAVTSFDRYYYAQQDRQGAVIDERFNGGGLLDDYMVGVMSRRLVGGVTTFPGGAPLRLPVSGILGPKVLLVNEQAGSGGDFFPWVFRELGVGPLIGTRTWGGLVNAAVPYPLVDGGTITAPAQAVFDAKSQWIAEGVGVHPDIEVLQDAKSVAAGRDPQLERGVREALRLLETQAVTPPKAPAFVKKGGQ